MNKNYDRRNFLRAGAVTGLTCLSATALKASPSMDEGSTELVQSFDLYRQNNEYVVRGHIDHKQYKKTKTADAALQFAIDLLKKGGEILVQPGNYELSKQINLRSRVSIRGSGPATSFIVASNHNTGIAFSAVGCDRLSISALSVKAPSEHAKAVAGVVLDHCGDCTLIDLFCLGFDHGIMLSNHSFLCEVRGCKIAGSHKSGIYLTKLGMGGRGGDFVPNLVTNCIVYGGAKGIECEFAIVVNIVACQVYQTRLPAFHFHSESNSIVVSGSRSFQIRNDAVVVEDSHELNITGNTFCWHEGHGIVLRNVSWGLVSSNEIIDTGSINIAGNDADKERWSYWIPAPDNLEPFKKNGLSLLQGTKGLAITGNAIFNWGSGPAMQHGILEDESCELNVVTGNNINFCNTGLALNGKGTKETNNVVEAKKPHLGGNSITARRLHRFDVRLIERFIEAQV